MPVGDNLGELTGRCGEHAVAVEQLVEAAGDVGGWHLETGLPFPNDALRVVGQLGEVADRQATLLTQAAQLLAECGRLVHGSRPW